VGTQKSFILFSVTGSFYCLCIPYALDAALVCESFLPCSKYLGSFWRSSLLFLSDLCNREWLSFLEIYDFLHNKHKGISKSFRTGRLKWELQIVQLSASRCSCIGILWVSLVSFATITLLCCSQQVFIFVVVCYPFSLETFGYTHIYEHYVKNTAYIV